MKKHDNLRNVSLKIDFAVYFRNLYLFPLSNDWFQSIIKWFFYFVCSGEQPNIVWTGYGKKTPVLIFSAQNIVNRKPEI